MRRLRIYFRCMRPFKFGNISRKLNNRELHSVTKSEKRNFFLAAITYGGYFTFNSPASESTRNNYTVIIFQFFNIQSFGIQPLNLRLAASRISRMLYSLYYRNVRIRQNEIAGAEILS